MLRGVCEMKPKYLILMVVILLLAGVVSADVSYATQGAGETDKGADGVMVPIGIPVTHLYLYTWISLGFLALIAASAAQRNGEFWAILLPIFAAMFVWWGWLVMPTAQGIGIIIMTGVLAFAVYAKGKQQEKFGIAGPGSPFLNIVFWMVIIQASIGFINATGLFSGTGNSAVTPLLYQNVDLATSVPDIASTGGFFKDITADLYLMGAAGFSAMMMFWKVLLGIVYFKGLVLSIAPFLADNTIVDLFLNVLTVGIDIVVVIAVWIWLFKPPIGEAV